MRGTRKVGLLHAMLKLELNDRNQIPTEQAATMGKLGLQIVVGLEAFLAKPGNGPLQFRDRLSCPATGNTPFQSGLSHSRCQ